ncbi:MAG: biotin-independent malonate decarboxylase subunit gamma [Victivallaceae bacterium]
MKINELLSKAFPAGYNVDTVGNLVFGQGNTASGPVEIVGTQNNTTIGIDELLELSRRFIKIMKEAPGRSIFMLVDNDGQKMALHDELLGLNQYIAHLIKLQDLAYRRGHKVVALVYGNSIAGGFIAFGLCAGATYAMPDANTSVMILPAIARVTKLSLEYLEELSKTVPVFAPGVNNFYLTGGLREIWNDDPAKCLAEALEADQSGDIRQQLGSDRGGRKMAMGIAREIVNG